MTNTLIYVAKTKYKNTCTKCNEEIPAGTSCYWIKGTKQNYHEYCKPSGASASLSEANPSRKAGAAPSAGSTPLAEGAVIVKAVEDRFIRAKEMLKRQAPEAENYADYYNLLTEIIKQLQSQEWLMIEKRRRV